MRILLERLTRQQAAVPQGPRLASWVGTTMTQQERQQLLARPHQRHHRVAPCPYQIAHGLVHLVGNPDRRQTARAMVEREHLRIPPVGLDTVAWLASDQGRRRDQAAMTHLRQLAVDPVATAASLATELQVVPLMLSL